MQKDYIHTLMILSSMSEFGGSRKHKDTPAGPACPKNVRFFIILKLEGEEEEKEEGDSEMEKDFYC